jgi:hypothetical protein
MKEQPKNILILVGRGKSVLTDWIENLYLIENQLYTIYGIKELVKKSDEIKSDVSVGFRVIVHLQSEEDIKKIPLGIKRRAWIFKLDY